MDEQNQFQQANPEPVAPPPPPPPQPNIMPAQPQMAPPPEIPQQMNAPMQPIVSDFASPVAQAAPQPQADMPPVFSPPQPGYGPAGTSMQQPAAPMSQSQMAAQGLNKRKSGKLKFLLIILAGIVLLGGGSAAAYFGVVVPSKPENRIASGAKNMLESDEWVATSTAEVSGAESFGAVKAESVTQFDRTAKAMSAKSTVTIGGIKVPFESRYVDKSIFVKVDDLTAVKNLLNAAAPEYSPIVEGIEKRLFGSG